jgi:hypothetical protein
MSGIYTKEAKHGPVRADRNDGVIIPNTVDGGGEGARGGSADRGRKEDQES